MTAPYSMKRLAAYTSVGLAIVIGVFAAVNIVFHEQLSAVAAHFVHGMGGAGVPLGYFVVSAFCLPFADDSFALLGLIGGMPFSSVLGLAIAGSVTGGVVAFFLGRALRHTGFYARLLKDHDVILRQIVSEYGAYGIAIAALTPLPDSPMCWICGAMRLPFPKFLPAYVLGRTLRLSYGIWVIDLAVTNGVFN